MVNSLVPGFINFNLFGILELKLKSPMKQN